MTTYGPVKAAGGKGGLGDGQDVGEGLTHQGWRVTVLCVSGGLEVNLQFQFAKVYDITIVQSVL